MDPMWSFLLVDGLGEVMIRYLASDGPCYYLLYMLYFWIELPVQRRLNIVVSGYPNSQVFSGLMVG